jgi:hypothetical protein
MNNRFPLAPCVMGQKKVEVRARVMGLSCWRAAGLTAKTATEFWLAFRNDEVADTWQSR